MAPKAEAKVKIRFLGQDFWRGEPQKKFIDVGNERFWNYSIFKEQEPDGSYIRSMSFYQQHKEILSDPTKFVIEIGDVGTRKNVVAPLSLPKELADKGVVEVDGVLLCPQCDFTADSIISMSLHLPEHGI